MNSYTLIGNRVYAPGVPDAQALMVENGHIVWIGDRHTALALSSKEHQVIHLQDSFIAPGFVDAHVHLTATGMHASSLQLQNVRSFKELADIVNEKFKSGHLDSEIFFGHGWDDANWSDSFDIFVSETEHVTCSIYLSRVDGHSAIIRHSALGTEPQVVSGDQQNLFRKVLVENMDIRIREHYISKALEQAASQGVVAVHENGGPIVSSEIDFQTTLKLGSHSNQPLVVGYWGDQDIDKAMALGAQGAAGDFSVDGSLGSHSAFLTEPYADHAGLCGKQYLDVDQIATHFIESTRRGIQAGFHAIGDAALAAISEGLKKTLNSVSLAELRRCRHRLEHVEMPSKSDLETFAECGIIVSVQPVFDEIWGDSNGMYHQRLGTNRYESMNPLNDMLRLGVVMAFGSDSPVTPIDPWRTIRAAINHHQPWSRISARAAFIAHTRGGWRASRDDISGTLAIGAPAHIAVWDVREYVHDVPDERQQHWSTDIRSGTHPLPNLQTHTPECVLTIRDGLPIFDPNQLLLST